MRVKGSNRKMDFLISLLKKMANSMRANFPGWLKSFAKVNLEAYAVDAWKSILFKSAGLSLISGEVLFLFCFTSVTMTLSIATVKRTL